MIAVSFYSSYIMSCLERSHLAQVLDAGDQACLLIFTACVLTALFLRAAVERGDNDVDVLAGCRYLVSVRRFCRVLEKISLKSAHWKKINLCRTELVISSTLWYAHPIGEQSEWNSDYIHPRKMSHSSLIHTHFLSCHRNFFLFYLKLRNWQLPHTTDIMMVLFWETMKPI